LRLRDEPHIIRDAVKLKRIRQMNSLRDQAVKQDRRSLPLPGEDPGQLAQRDLEPVEEIATFLPRIASALILQPITLSSRIPTGEGASG
jgi:hypothetical protein